MAETETAAPAIVTPEGFIRDQLGAARVLREEKLDEAAKSLHDRRLDAVHAALRFIDVCGAGQNYTAASVIALARQFEAYFQEP